MSRASLTLGAVGGDSSGDIVDTGWQPSDHEVAAVAARDVTDTTGSVDMTFVDSTGLDYVGPIRYITPLTPPFEQRFVVTFNMGGVGEGWGADVVAAAQNATHQAARDHFAGADWAAGWIAIGSDWSGIGSGHLALFGIETNWLDGTEAGYSENSTIDLGPVVYGVPYQFVLRIEPNGIRMKLYLVGDPDPGWQVWQVADGVHATEGPWATLGFSEIQTSDTFLGGHSRTGTLDWTDWAVTGGGTGGGSSGGGGTGAILRGRQG